MRVKKFNYIPDANDTLLLLVETNMLNQGYQVTHTSPLTTGADELSGILTHHHPKGKPEEKAEVLWVLDAENSCVRGYTRTADYNYRTGWVESSWAMDFFKDYNRHIASVFADFFEVLRERAAGTSVKTKYVTVQQPCTVGEEGTQAVRTMYMAV